jgi:hypothetical protein
VGSWLAFRQSLATAIPQSAPAPARTAVIIKTLIGRQIRWGNHFISLSLNKHDGVVIYKSTR